MACYISPFVLGGRAGSINSFAGGYPTPSVRVQTIESPCPLRESLHQSPAPLKVSEWEAFIANPMYPQPTIAFGGGYPTPFGQGQATGNSPIPGTPYPLGESMRQDPASHDVSQLEAFWYVAYRYSSQKLISLVTTFQ